MDRALALTSAQRALLPADDDIASYERDGYYISRCGVIPDDLLEAAVRGSEAFYRGERDGPLLPAGSFSDWRPGDGNGPRNNEFVSLQKKELRQLALYPLLGAIAATLTRSRTIRVLDDQLVYKPPNRDNPSDTVTGWHADHAYWATCSSDKLITAWIPLHDVEIARGPLVVMAGSHRWPGLQDIRGFNQKNLEELVHAFRREGREIRLVPMTLRKGQVSFHHCWTIHASYPNTSREPRLSFAVHLQDGDNRYRPYRNAQGKDIHIFDETLCRKLDGGDPDFGDPAVFPVISSEDA